MRKASRSEVKKYLLNALIEFDKVCRNNGLQYSLYAGTLLGAVRHNGFIPWDDDADVLMPYNSYKKLILISKNKIFDKKYKFMCHENDKDYNYSFGKFFDINTVCIEKGIDRNTSIGISVDVFAMYPLAGETFEDAYRSRKIVSKYCGFIGNCLYKHYPRHDKNIIIHCLKCIRHFFIRLRPMDYYYSKGKKYLLNNSSIKNKYFTNFWGDIKNIFPAKIFNGYLKHKFEGHTFSIVKGYDIMLRSVYGDYMRFPPKSERHGGHNTNSYVK